MKIKDFLSLVKFSHTIFAMPFAFIGFFIALKEREHSFDWKILLLVVLCMIFARNAAMGFNRYLDRKIDFLNPRTKNREIPRGTISSIAAIWFIIVNCIAFIAATYFLNTLTFFLSPVALFVILFYSYTKRFTALCHLVLGLGLSLAPIGAYIAVNGNFALLPIIFSLIVLFWVSGFDIIYSLQDEDFDKKEKLKSIPAYLGRKGALNTSLILHFLTIVFVILAGYLGPFHYFYWMGASVFILMLTYQHIIVKPSDISKVNMAFATLNGIASLIFGFFTIIDLWLNNLSF